MERETPLMFTAVGNVPVDSLKYEHRWTDTDAEMKFEEFWYLNEELVRNNCHIYKKQTSNDVTIGLEGCGIGGQQAQMQ